MLSARRLISGSDGAFSTITKMPGGMVAWHAVRRAVIPMSRLTSAGRNSRRRYPAYVSSPSWVVQAGQRVAFSGIFDKQYGQSLVAGGGATGACC